MTRWEGRFLNLANLLVGGTGVIYAIMRYFMRPADEWAVVNHPWQPHLQHLHVLTAPLLIFACGLIWQRHVMGNLGRDDRRGASTGPGLLLTLVPMTLSGYLIQTTTGETWRQIWIVTHLVASSAWLLAFAGHLVGAYWVKTRRDSGKRGGRTPGAVPGQDGKGSVSGFS